MRLLVVLAVVAVPLAANADATWDLDLGIRGAGTLAFADAPMSRSGAVPSMTIRARRMFGRAFVGANLAAGFPAYVGQHEASLAVGLGRTLRDGRCVRADLDAPLQCDARLVLLGGFDAGSAMLHYDAPPELSSDSDAVLYWGPLVRARVALRATWPTPTGKEIGVTVGAGTAVSFARYMTTATGTSMRFEPLLDVALVVGF